MRTFYYYENPRKRYKAMQTATEGTTYVLEYRVKNFNTFGKSFYTWRHVLDMISKLKFKEVKPLIDRRVNLDREIRTMNRKTYTNPFLEYINDLD
jgi:hypothetical protein